MGMQVYSVQYTTILCAATILTMGVVLMKHWRAFTPDEDIARLERSSAEKRRAGA